MTNKGKWVKLIPSLAGGLYRFDGATVEAVPLDAETLLRSSFKFDNMVMTGGKESRTYGVDMDTGRIRYECTIDGCEKFDGAGEESLDDVIVVQRETQTVRAVEPRSGQEKWNFSVSQHSVEVQRGMEDLCDGDAVDDYDDDDDENDDDAVMKAVVSEGLLCSMERGSPDEVDWRRKFDAPIVHAWRIRNGRLASIDLFSTSSMPDKMPSIEEEDANFHVQTPLLYIGTHNRQLYIQESDRARARSKKVRLDLQAPLSAQFPKVSWRPYLISSHTRTPVINHGQGGGADRDRNPNRLPMLTYDSDTADTTALAVINGGGPAGYPFDSGLYLFPDDERQLEYEPPQGGSDLDDDDGNATVVIPARLTDEEESEQPAIQVVFVSLWYWWKEVMFISFVTAFFMNVLITRPLLREIRLKFRRRLDQVLLRQQQQQPQQQRQPNVVVVEVPVQVPVPMVPSSNNATPSSPETVSAGVKSEFSWKQLSSQSSEEVSNAAPAAAKEFVSRYLQVFLP